MIYHSYCNILLVEICHVLKTHSSQSFRLCYPSNLLLHDILIKWRALMGTSKFFINKKKKKKVTNFDHVGRKLMSFQIHLWANTRNHIPLELVQQIQCFEFLINSNLADQRLKAAVGIQEYSHDCYYVYACVCILMTINLHSKE